MSYKELDVHKTVATIHLLETRILERFPNSGLGAVCKELHQLAAGSTTTIARIKHPNYYLRIGIGTLILVMVLTLIYSLSVIDYSVKSFTIADLVTISEATINDIVLIGAAIFFLISIETRIGRRLALSSLRELRSIAHVIDMHQLTKYPGRIKEWNTENSPKLTLTPYKLTRYLDYCSEMLALTGKVAALYAENSGDAVVISTINEVESLTTGLSRKVWQKIMILDRMDEQEDELAALGQEG